MLTARGRFALALGGGTYVGAWAFGSAPLYPVAAALVLAVAGAWLWVRAVDRPPQVHRSTSGAALVEGDSVPVDLELDHPGRVVPRGVIVVDRLERLPEQTLAVTRRGDGRLGGRYTIWRVPRGRYRVLETVVRVEDSFGLARAEQTSAGEGSLLVLPRVVELPTLFTDTGGRASDGRRLLLRRASGFDFHGVRDHADGESLRRVHWPSTAHRGQLMVKELEDAPRDDVVVVLDASADALAGEPPESSFDLQVRAAGSILLAHARRGRRAALAVAGARIDSRRIAAAPGDHVAALELLASAEATGRAPVEVVLGAADAATRAVELVFVTARLPVALVHGLVQRAVVGRRRCALVVVDVRSFGAGTSPAADAVARLQAAGVAVARVRRGDDLASVLAAAPVARAVHA